MVQNHVLRRTRDSIIRIEERTRQSLARLEVRLQLKRKAILRGVASLWLPLLALVLALVDPVPKLGRWYMKMAEGYNGYSLFEKPPIGSYNKVYLFNVTNADRFLSGQDGDLKLQEVGPFTYLEYRWNSNISVDWRHGVVRFIPQMNVSFVPELSVGHPADVRLVVPNIPLLSMSSVVAEYSMWTSLGFNMLVQSLKSTPFRSLSAHDYLWGYEDELVRMAHTVLPLWIDSPKIGILQQLYTGYGEKFVEMELGAESRYQLRSWAGSSSLPQWEHANYSRSTCNRLQGSYEGMFFTPGFTMNSTFDMYRKPMCRTVPMKAYGTNITSYGIKIIDFGLAENAFDVKDNDCVCQSSRCLPRGLSDLSPCYKGVPFAMSKPHFLDCDQLVFNKLEGLHPDEERHGTVIGIEPELGIPLKAVSSSQTNLVVGDIRYVTAAKPFRNIIFPVVWFNMVFQDIPPDVQLILRWRFIFGPSVVLALELLLLISGLLVAGYNLFLYIRPWGYTKMEYLNVPTTEKEMQFVHKNPMIDDAFW